MPLFMIPYLFVLAFSKDHDVVHDIPSFLITYPSISCDCNSSVRVYCDLLYALFSTAIHAFLHIYTIALPKVR